MSSKGSRLAGAGGEGKTGISRAEPLVSRPIILRVLRERLEKNGSDTQEHIKHNYGPSSSNGSSGQAVRFASPESPLAGEAPNLIKRVSRTWKRASGGSRSASLSRPLPLLVGIVGSENPDTRVGGATAVSGAYSEDL